MQNEVPQFLVVALGYNRPASLRRLLSSLECVEPVECNADLVVSIDGGGNPKCGLVASAVEWQHGRKEVVVHESHMGLKTHVETATDRVMDYDAVIVLEDDLLVSPWMLHYGLEVYRAYGDLGEIAQISLYSYHLNEFTRLPFRPLDYGTDAWLLRVPSSWGQMYTRRQWELYRSWEKNEATAEKVPSVPPMIYTWKHTWKRAFFEYVSSKKLWVVYPYCSLTTNHGDVGANYPIETRDLQVPLELTRRRYQFTAPSQVVARYDEWFEPLPETMQLSLRDELVVDLGGAKPFEQLGNRYLLSTKPCASPITTYSVELVPLEMNVRLGIRASSSTCIALGRVADFSLEAPTEEIVAKQVAGGISSFWFSRGKAQGHRDVRSSSRYRLGCAILDPLQRFLQCCGLKRRE